VINTPLNLISRALVKLQVKAPGQALTAAEAQDALRELNQMVSAWRNDRLAMFLVERLEFALSVANQQVYTIGAGGDFNVPRPLKIEHCGLIDTVNSPTFEHDLGEPLSIQRWQETPFKTQPGTIVDRVYYEPTHPLGKIYVHPVPTGTTLKLVLYIAASLGQFASLTAQYDFPDGYEDALLYNLAIRLAPEYEREPQPIIVRLAQEAFERIKRTNTPDEELELDPALPGMSPYGQYDIYTDEFRR
jgi:hypothetical protein